MHIFKSFKALIILLSFFYCNGQNQNLKKNFKIDIIPKPLSFERFNGTHYLQKNTTIFLHDEDKSLIDLAQYFIDEINKNFIGYKFNIVSNIDNEKQQAIYLILSENQDPTLSEEGYSLEIKKSITITANTPNGIFYGLQSLLQLITGEFLSKETKDVLINLPKIQINDKPRFKYRGMHLDVCRHFIQVDSIKRYIDLLAMHKMNYFHWHLTEDQGWRIEIKKYPKLTEIGSKRKETIIDKNFKPFKGDGKPYGGYYTQEEIKEIVEYAKKRYITVIPEIELPGHSMAALASYPELGCTGGPYEVSTVWGVRDDVFCAGNELVFQFLEDVLSEVIELFPSEFIHIGGDECPKNKWKECSKCQSRIAEEGLKDENHLQSYFITRIEKFLNSQGKIIIGWDEILEGGLAPNATVMSWRGVKGGIAAVKQQHNVIMTPNTHCYFDHYQDNPEIEPLAIGGFTTLKKVYFYEPVPKELLESEVKYILGAQANVWTEYIKTYKHVEYMSVPRISALAEVVWSTKEKRNWEDFLDRLQTQFRRFDLMNINYHKTQLIISNESEINDNKIIE